MYEICSDYKNSRWVNYNRWSDCQEVLDLVAELTADVENRKKSLYDKNMMVLVLDLFQSFLTDPEQYVIYFRGSNHYDFMRERYLAGDRYADNPHISFDGFVGSVDLLRRGCYILNSRGGNFYNKELGEYGFQSRMRATAKLVDLWRKYHITPDMVGRFCEPKVIIMKNVPTEKIINKGKPNEKTILVKKDWNYKPSNRIAARLSVPVRAYNRLLDATHIDCDAACLADDDRAELVKRFKAYKKNQKAEIRIKLLSKNVYRVFNNRRWDNGGRFYGAWWIGCPSELRKYITLDGDPTVELDYSAIHIHLLYAQKGINYAVKKEDAYTLEGGLADKELDREFNKLIMLTALNAETETKARDSVYDELRKDKKLKKYNLTDKYDFPLTTKKTPKGPKRNHKEPILRKLLLLKEKHAPIADMIASGEGIRLQYLDSCIIEKLIKFAVHTNISILTVHDSVICQTKHADTIKDKMWYYFTELINEKLSFTIRYENSNPSTKHKINILAEQAKVQRPQFDYIQYNPLYSRLNVKQNTIRDWLKPDDVVKIKTDSRTNVCSCDCRHYKRIVSYQNRVACHLGTIVVKLVNRYSEPELIISE